MPTPLRVLFIDDSEVDVELILAELGRSDFAPVQHERVEDQSGLAKALASGGWDVVLSDHGMPRFTGLEALAMLKKQGLDLPFILVSGTIGETQAVAVMRAGACDYVMKDRLGRLGPTIRRELDEAVMRRERRSAQEHLKAERNFISAILDTAGALVMVLDPGGRVTRVNRAFEKLTGYTLGEISGKPFWDLFLAAEDAQAERARLANFRPCDHLREHESSWRSRTQTARRISWTETAIVNDRGDVSFFIWTGIDVTEKTLLQAKLEHDALHDALTGLANRTLFLDRLGQQMRHVQKRNDGRFAVLFIDIDRFKFVNDSLGHGSGDQLLREIAGRLGTCVRPGDTIARLGGDEFGILLEDIRELADATVVADRIERCLAAPLHLEGQEVTTSASIGIALSAEGYSRAEDLLRDADTAMYRAKAKGRARFEVFDQAMKESSAARLELETDLRRALERGELAVYYQPIVEVVGETLVGFESLVRWNHPRRGLVSPHEFIPLAEELGLIATLDLWVLREACRQMKEWQDRHARGQELSISVNLSGRHFSHLDVAGEVERILKETGLPSRSLNLELTESALLESTVSARQALVDLRFMGVKLHLDDFGTGYSSLSYLRNFPINALKVDRSFVSGLTPARDGEVIVRAIVALAHNLEMNVVAEGVETLEQLALLREMDCEFAQGFHFSKPLAREAASKIAAQAQITWQNV